MNISVTQTSSPWSPSPPRQLLLLSLASAPLYRQNHPVKRPMESADENLQVSVAGRKRAQGPSRPRHRPSPESPRQRLRVARGPGDLRGKPAAAEGLTRRAAPFHPPLPGRGGGACVTSWRLAESGSDPRGPSCSGGPQRQGQLRDHELVSEAGAPGPRCATPCVPESPRPCCPHGPSGRAGPTGPGSSGLPPAPCWSLHLSARLAGRWAGRSRVCLVS